MSDAGRRRLLLPKVGGEHLTGVRRRRTRWQMAAKGFASLLEPGFEPAGEVKFMAALRRMAPSAI